MNCVTWNFTRITWIDGKL